MKQYLRGEIIWVDFGMMVGSVQSGERPAIIIQNNVGNRYSPNTIVVPLTTKVKKSMPTHFKISYDNYNFLHGDSVVICEQIITVSKEQIKGRLGQVNEGDFLQIERKIGVSMGLKLAS